MIPLAGKQDDELKRAKAKFGDSSPEAHRAFNALAASMRKHGQKEPNRKDKGLKPHK